MGREVGGGIGVGKTCEPKAFSFQCMTKFTTKKKKNLNQKKNKVKRECMLRVLITKKKYFSFDLYKMMDIN